MEVKKRLLLVDSYALIYRAYFAYPKTLTLENGSVINAVYGFFNLLLDLLLKYKSEEIICIFDSNSPTIRSQEFVSYKANRKQMEPELASQIDLLLESLKKVQISNLSVPGFEADDIIGTLTKLKYQDYDEILIVTGDQDIFQLINPKVSVLLAGKTFSQSTVYKKDDVYKKLGVFPEQIVDYKALAGDPSDNIPGIKGIGKTTAAKLLGDFYSFENIWSNVDKVESKISKKLLEGYSEGVLSQKLARIDTNVPLGIDVDLGDINRVDFIQMTKIIKDFGFKSLRPKLENLMKEYCVKNVDFIELKETKNINNLDEIANLANISLISIYFNVKTELGKKFFSDIKFYFPEENKLVKTEDKNIINEILEFIKKGGIKIILYDLKNFIYFLELYGKDFSIDEFIIQDLNLLSKLVYAGKGILKDLTSISQLILEYEVGDFPVNFLEIYQKIKGQIKKDNWVEKKFEELIMLESSVVELLPEIEKEGIMLDSEGLEDFSFEIGVRIENLKENIFNLAKKEINLNSPSQVSKLLFEDLGLKSRKKTKNGKLSTNEKVLNELAAENQIVKDILDYRELEKMRSTYAVAFRSFVDEKNMVHSDFDNMGAVSGRFSSNNPNLQNLPTSTAVGLNFRDLFIARDGNIFVSFDFSQQELRLLAEFSKEEKMTDLYVKGGDIHLLTASEIFKKNMDEITSEERSIGKTINFSIVYGISSFGLAERMKISPNYAQELIDKYFETYPRIQEFFRYQKTLANKNGFAESILGRRRYFDLSNANFFQRQAMEREILNFVVQASAADQMKVSMVNISKNVLPFFKARFVLQIHDEFLFEIDETEDIEKFMSEVVFQMKKALPVKIPMKVGISTGKKFGSLLEK